VSTGPGRISAARDKSARRIPSDGLSVDTATGCADEVVARRLLAGIVTPATRADVSLAYALAPDLSFATVRRVAAAAGVSFSTAQRGILRARGRRIGASL
jgi:hypothetical protein